MGKLPFDWVKDETYGSAGRLHWGPKWTDKCYSIYSISASAISLGVAWEPRFSGKVNIYSHLVLSFEHCFLFIVKYFPSHLRPLFATRHLTPSMTATLALSELPSNSQIISNEPSIISSRANKTHWWSYKSKKHHDPYLRNYEKQFTGRSARKYFRRIWRPEASGIDPELGNLRETYIYGVKYGKGQYRNQWNKTVEKFVDVDVYLSPSSSEPRRLVVQATRGVLKLSGSEQSNTKWIRTEIEGDIPQALRMAEWALRPKLWIYKSLRIMLVSFPLQILLVFPGAEAPWESTDLDDDYRGWAGYQWEWPKHATNPLDMGDHNTRAKTDMTLSSKRRLNRPRLLITYRNGKWALESNPPKDLQYVFISWQWDAFGDTEEERKTKVHRMAEYMTLRAGLTAYWLDNECNAPKSERALLTSDVHRMSDVIRGSNQVALLLPDGKDYRMRDWGRRMWTLPEGLLAPGEVQVCTWQGEGKYNVRLMNKVEMTSQFWLDNDKESGRMLEEEPSRILAEHFERHITLSRLELFSLGLSALCNRTTSNNFTGSDEAYALMGLLHYRIDTDETDELFQVVSRLSLANDSDHLIERLFAMFPYRASTIQDIFKTCADKDQYRTHLWDIQPKCEIVGIGTEPNTVILNDCKAVTIRWRQFPRIRHQNHEGFRRLVAQIFVTSGAWWVTWGYTLGFTYAPFILTINQGGDHQVQNNNKLYDYCVGLIGAFLIVGFLLSFTSPFAVRRLFSSQVLKSAPHLVGFEGIMPIEEIEEIAFGNCRHRLAYEPSATPYSAEKRDPKFRKAEQPDWVRDSNPAAAQVSLQPGHRLFTLVDTGNLTVSIFQAERPPSVALICGAEGGALRAALCSWRFDTDCLYKETVIRVPSSTWHETQAVGWVKVSFLSQDSAMRAAAQAAKERREGHGETTVKEKGF